MTGELSGAPLRVGLYGRVSIDVRVGKSVDGQLDVGRAWATSRGWPIVGEYRDDGITAFDPKKARPDWTRAMDDIQARKFDVLWVWEVSRASRDRAVWAALIAACQASDVLLAIDGKLHDVTDPDDGFNLDLGAALAVRESAQIGKRVRRATKKAADAGAPFGAVPFGYTREYDPSSGSPLRQLPDPDTAPIVREMVARVLAGDALHAIAVEFNARGVLTPQQARDRRAGRDPSARTAGWSNGKIRKVLLTPSNAGWRVHRGEIHGPAAWEPLVSEADHAAVTTILTDPARRTHRGTEPRHLLSGIATCGVCGAWLRRFSNRGYPSYTCAGLSNTTAGHVVRRQLPLEACVEGYMIKRLSEPRLLEGLARSRAQLDESLAEAGREVASLQEQLSEYEAKAVEGGPAAAVFERVAVGLLARIEAAQARLVSARVVPSGVLELAGPDAAQRWAALDADDGGLQRKRQAIRALVRVVVHKSPVRNGSSLFHTDSVQLIKV